MPRSEIVTFIVFFEDSINLMNVIPRKEINSINILRCSNERIKVNFDCREHKYKILEYYIT